MGTKTTQSGFTVVEVMLVLAVTGLMLVGIFGGASAQINIQRYRDSVTSYQSVLKDQFSKVQYTANQRFGQESCINGTDDVPTVTTTPKPRGTSKCLVIGRYITTSGTNGDQLDMDTILAYQVADDDPAQSDVDNLRNYRFTRIDSDDTYRLNWGSTIGRAATDTNLAYTIAVLRSPTSGSLLTFKNEVANTPLATLVGMPLNQNFDMCVRNAAGIFISSPLAVRINAGAASGSAIEIPSESDRICR